MRIGVHNVDLGQITTMVVWPPGYYAGRIGDWVSELDSRPITTRSRRIGRKYLVRLSLAAAVLTKRDFS